MLHTDVNDAKTIFTFEVANDLEVVCFSLSF